jgi:hypothetical protein
MAVNILTIRQLLESDTFLGASGTHAIMGSVEVLDESDMYYTLMQSEPTSGSGSQA